jgi:hypothetical protein
MPSFAGHFEYLAPGGAVEQSGSCEFSFDRETATLVPGGRPPVAFDLGDIETFGTGDYELRLSLHTGYDLKLLRFGKPFQDLARELLDAYRDRLVKCLLVSDLDEVARFTGRVQLESASGAAAGPAEIRLYESNLAVLPDAATGFQWRLAEITAVEFDVANYAVVFVREGERLTVGRLAKRTGELVERVQSRITALSERTARTLHALFPFLSPSAFAEVAGLMRDGACTPVAKVAAVHELIEAVLLEKVVGSPLRQYVQMLSERSPAHGWYAGLKIIRGECDDTGEPEDATPADGAGETADVVGEGGSGRDGGLSEARDPAVFEAGDGLEVLYWFFFPLAAKGGEVSHVAWETTSRGGRATYVFRRPQGAPVDAAVAALNRGLVALNFRREPVYLPARTLEAELRFRHYAIAQRKLPDLARVREAFVGRAIHAGRRAWTARLDALAGGPVR